MILTYLLIMYYIANYIELLFANNILNDSNCKVFELIIVMGINKLWRHTGWHWIKFHYRICKTIWRTCGCLYSYIDGRSNEKQFTGIEVYIQNLTLLSIYLVYYTVKNFGSWRARRRTTGVVHMSAHRLRYILEPNLGEMSTQFGAKIHEPPLWCLSWHVANQNF